MTTSALHPQTTPLVQAKTSASNAETINAFARFFYLLYSQIRYNILISVAWPSKVYTAPRRREMATKSRTDRIIRHLNWILGPCCLVSGIISFLSLLTLLINGKDLFQLSGLPALGWGKWLTIFFLSVVIGYGIGGLEMKTYRPTTPKGGTAR